MRRAGRQRELLLSGVVDSFGMALGWTVVVLLANARGGLSEAALYNAAMLAGVVLSAPAAGWLSRRLNGRLLLRGAAAVEGLLRLVVLGGLIAGLPSWLIAPAVVVMHTAAWAGFAGMRAEITAVDGSPRSMTRYAVSIAGVEAAGTALAALLPVGAGGHPTGWLLGAVFVAYVGSLLPTVLTARRARISTGRRGGYVAAPAARRRPSIRMLAAGGGVMLIASGPTLLAVPVTEQLHGGRWVAAAAVAFSLGTLLSTTAGEAIRKLHLPAVLRWSLWGLGMLVGWIFAPGYAPMVLVAQFAAGVSQTAFEGDMDSRVAEEAAPAQVTRDLAYSASVRAFGGAISVRALPLLVAAPAIGMAASLSAILLGATAIVIWAGLTLMPQVFRRLAH